MTRRVDPNYDSEPISRASHQRALRLAIALAIAAVLVGVVWAIVAKPNAAERANDACGARGGVQQVYDRHTFICKDGEAIRR